MFFKSKKRILLVTKRIIITGKVQNVWFRAWIRDMANKLSIKGWVRNLSDGKVEAVFQGNEDDITKLIKLCWIGPTEADVDDILVYDLTGKTKESYINFRQRVSD